MPPVEFLLYKRVPRSSSRICRRIRNYAMRTIYLSKSDEHYLYKCAVESGNSYGIIIGQRSCEERFFVVHLAKNQEEDAQVSVAFCKKGKTSEANDKCNPEQPNNVIEFNTQAIANQWLGAAKMVPGSFEVLGVFLASTRPDIINDQTSKDGKKMLNELHSLLVQGNTFANTIEDVTAPSYIFLVYSHSTLTINCQIFTTSANGGSYSPLESRILKKPIEWHTVECNYELDDIFPILEFDDKVNLEHEFQRTVEAMRKSLAVSEVFFHGEASLDRMMFDSYLRERKAKDLPPPRDGLPAIIKAAIYLPVKFQVYKGHTIAVREFNGSIRLSGVVSSRIWCHPRNTMGEVKHFVREDILRSIATRIQMYCDGLTEPNIVGNSVFVSEPPRRVYFNMPTDGDIRPIQFSEYIFRGEAPNVAVAGAKQVLDIDINSDCIIADLEGLTHEEETSDTTSEILSFSQGATENTQETSRNMFMLGITVALLVLIVSMILSYFLF